MKRALELSKIKLFAFDLDGTLYVGNKAVPGAVELIRHLRKKYKVVFFTNNSSKTLREIYKKLIELKIECKLSEIFTSSSATAEYLKEKRINDLYVVGTKSFRSELKNIGLRIVNNDSAKNLVVGLDTDFNYSKLSIALSVLQNGGKFIACNEDGRFPIGKKRFLPGTGAMVGAIVAASKKRPDFIVGKPNTYILLKISKAFGVGHQGIMVVGDSYDSDIMMAFNYNCKSVFIKNNGAAKKDVIVMKNLNELLQYIRGGK